MADLRDVVIVDAVRSPIGRRNGGLSTCHSADLLAGVLGALVSRTGLSPAEVDQVIGGCVSQVGMQSYNVVRTAWLTAGFPVTTAATTVDSQCGSSQQATSIASGLIASGVIDVAIACGVEMMSRVPMGSNTGQGLGKAISRKYFEHFEFTSQFEGAERIADRWGISRNEADQLGVQSQERAARSWDDGFYDSQVVPIEAPDLDEQSKPVGTFRRVERDEGLRDTTLEGVEALSPVGRPDGIHTAATTSQISDGAAALLLMSADKAGELGLPIRARIRDTCLVGCDPVLMLTGPIGATTRLLERNHMKMSDIGLTEINEAFASVVIAWAREFNPDWESVNPNGGAIALGHALGSTGVTLITKALNGMEQRDEATALVTMCCGGGLGTGAILERL